MGTRAWPSLCSLPAPRLTHLINPTVLLVIRSLWPSLMDLLSPQVFPCSFRTFSLNKVGETVRSLSWHIRQDTLK